MALLELANVRCAFVWSADGRIVWSKTSSSFGFPLYSHAEICDGTGAFDLFQGNSISADLSKYPLSYGSLRIAWRPAVPSGNSRCA